MGPGGNLPESITIDAFNQLLTQYVTLIKSLSSSKGAKPGQKTLGELDQFRYNEAIGLFSGRNPKRLMGHDDIKTLVDWKLRHGKFRPTLMNLVSSNDEDVVKDTIQSAMETYWAESDTYSALEAIGKLRGVGPATASLLLSVHDPERVIFFSDETFYWLCCEDKKSPIRYNAKEYRELNTAAQKLVKRLGVSATDVEKVAYVLMKQGASVMSSLTAPKEAMPSKKGAEKAPVMKTTAKRKVKANGEENEAETTQPVRRSKRGKAS